MSSLVLRSFNLVGHVIKEEIEIDDCKRRASSEEIAKLGTERLCAQMSSTTGLYRTKYDKTGITGFTGHVGALHAECTLNFGNSIGSIDIVAK